METHIAMHRPKTQLGTPQSAVAYGPKRLCPFKRPAYCLDCALSLARSSVTQLYTTSGH